MLHKVYNNFVRPVSSADPTTTVTRQHINGDEARQLYLEEVGNVEETFLINDANSNDSYTSYTKVTKADKNHKAKDLSTQNLFKIAQNNDVNKLKDVLNTFPDKINILDEYGWSLLMIACQANSTACAEELINRGINVSIRDKAGNSARSLVIRNNNIMLANLLLSERSETNKPCVKSKQVKEQVFCSICNKTFPDKNEHLSSTIHNLVASKGKKLPTNYIIPESNKGFQIMLRGGWDKESGLGLDGSGKKYPIKTVLKTDKYGLGHAINKVKSIKEIKCSKKVKSNCHRNRRIEIDFRRQFY